MTITPYLSSKIKVLSFIAIYLVLVIHTAMPQAKEFQCFDFFQTFCGDYICRLYLPLFMTVSGYLFYQGVTKSTKEVWLNKFIRRFKSLFIPYIIWNILFIVQLAILQYNPVTSPWISDGITPFISSGSFLQFLRMVFTNPANLPLWFVRDLMVIVVFTPLIYFIIINKLYPIVLLAMFLLSWKIGIAFNSLFFILGGVFAINKVNIEYRVKLNWLLLFIVSSIISGVLLALKAQITQLNFYLSIIPLIAIWFGYDFLYDRGMRFSFVNRILPFTFFIYVFHEPSLNIFKKLLVLIGDKSELSYWLTYILSPVLMVVFAYIVGSILNKIIPKTYSVLVGNRK